MRFMSERARPMAHSSISNVSNVHFPNFPSLSPSLPLSLSTALTHSIVRSKPTPNDHTTTLTSLHVDAPESRAQIFAGREAIRQDKAVGPLSEGEILDLR